MRPRSLVVHCLLLLSLTCLSLRAQAAPDSTKDASAQIGHQLRLGVDILRTILNLAQDAQQSYEASLDYYWRKELYIVLEGGAGSSHYDYPDLNYTSNSSFVRLGVDKTILSRLGPGDWDAAFFGLRYGLGFIQRGEASYLIVDSVWGNSSGLVPAKNFMAHWAELTGGVRVELLHGLFAGWDVRARFLLNGRSFQDLSPSFIAGYGRGDKTTVFDFNFYLLYAIRWGSKGPGH